MISIGANYDIFKLHNGIIFQKEVLEIPWTTKIAKNKYDWSKTYLI